LQFWLQLTAFLTVRRGSLAIETADQNTHWTAATRHERDHDGLAVWQ
jgi:hypothetical protein